MPKRNFRNYLIVGLKGVAMGAADTVPGVSGGTIAFISGIYEELISSIGTIDFSLIKTWRKEGFVTMWNELNGNFLLSLMLGILFSIFTIMRLTAYLLHNHPILVWSFFFGLVLASIWYVGAQIKRWNFSAVLLLIIGGVVAYFITGLSAAASSGSAWYLFISGAIAVCAMILPGISGAFILVLLGAYESVLHIVHDFNIKKIAALGIGVITGLLAFSKVLKWLFNHYKNATLAILTGFIAGSLPKIWPWKKVLKTKLLESGEEKIIQDTPVLPWNFEGDSMTLAALGLVIAGFLLIFILEISATKKPFQNGEHPNQNR